MSILTHKREQRKPRQERRRGLICASLRGRKTVPPLVPPPSFLLSCRVSSFCSLLEQHQRQSDAEEDAEEDAGDGEMTSVCVCDRVACGVVCGRPRASVGFNQMDSGPAGWHGDGCEVPLRSVDRR